ncbi:MAG: DNA polymerase I [Anaerolineae bacterium]|nr:DNA polymerase I [Anaerolineae bacterium]
MTDKKQTLILIDGHALAYRAYFGMPATFNTNAGEPTHAVYGFTNMLLAVWKEYEPDYFIVTFDLGDTFRHEMYEEYKATREKMPEDLNTQIDRIQQLVTALNMPIFTKEGYEADDLLGTLANQAAAKDIEAFIVTGDRDAFQLVAPNIKVVISGSKFADRVLYDEAKVEERYGVTPKQLIELKGLVGDSSDNIPGVKGIGEKGGAKLIQQYGTLEGIYDNLDKIAKGTRAKLEADRESAFLSRELGRIITDVPGVELNIQAGKTMDFDIVEVANLFVELEFNTIFNRIPGAPLDKSPEEVATVEPKTPTGPVDPDGTYITVDTEAKLETLVGQLKQSDRLCVDVETDSTDEVQAKLVGIAITPTAGEGYYIPLAHGGKAEPQPGEQASLFDEPEPADVPEQLALTTVQNALAPILARSDVLKYMHNAKFDMVLLRRHGMPVEPPIYDTMIAAYIGNNAPAARYGLKELVRENLNIQMTEIKELIGSGKNQLTMDQIPVEQVTPYAAADVDMTLRLADIVDKPLQEDKDFRHIFEELDLPLIYVLIDMELAGIKLDTDALRQMSNQMARRLGELEQEVYQVAGVEFNLNSTQQLSDVLFKNLGLPTQGLRKTKSGFYSTAANVLEGLQGQHPIIELILEHRTLAKLKSTYVDALPALVNPRTGRVHTNYNQIGISTGRLSSSDPNLQNIPIRTEQGREIRRAFVAEEGHYLIAADYSQVELRILAHITEDAGLLNAFENDEDIHTATASAVLGVPQDQIDKYQRRIAKTVNFGLIYGQTAFGLAQGTGMSREEARAFIETYFEKYPGVKAYIDRTEKLAAEQGYVETLLGRKRDFSQLAGLTGAQRARAEREAINMPIQGTAADIMKQAMITLHRELANQGFKTRMLLQVHDELVLEAPEDELDQAVKLTQEVMSRAFKLRIPLKVDVEVGQNWLEMSQAG